MNIHNFSNSSIIFTLLKSQYSFLLAQIHCCFSWRNTAKLQSQPCHSNGVHYSTLLSISEQPRYPGLHSWPGLEPWGLILGEYMMQTRPMRVFLGHFLRPTGGKCPLISRISRYKDRRCLKLPVAIFVMNCGDFLANEAHKEENRVNK